LSEYFVKTGFGVFAGGFEENGMQNVAFGW
jgi:hypothetical protein